MAYIDDEPDGPSLHDRIRQRMHEIVSSPEFAQEYAQARAAGLEFSEQGLLQMVLDEISPAEEMGSSSGFGRLENVGRGIASGVMAPLGALEHGLNKMTGGGEDKINAFREKIGPRPVPNSNPSVFDPDIFLPVAGETGGEFAATGTAMRPFTALARAAGAGKLGSAAAGMLPKGASPFVRGAVQALPSEVGGAELYTGATSPDQFTDPRLQTQNLLFSLLGAGMAGARAVPPSGALPGAGRPPVGELPFDYNTPPRAEPTIPGASVLSDPESFMGRPASVGVPPGSALSHPEAFTGPETPGPDMARLLRQAMFKGKTNTGYPVKRADQTVLSQVEPGSALSHPEAFTGPALLNERQMANMRAAMFGEKPVFPDVPEEVPLEGVVPETPVAPEAPSAPRPEAPIPAAASKQQTKFGRPIAEMEGGPNDFVIVKGPNAWMAHFKDGRIEPMPFGAEANPRDIYAALKTQGLDVSGYPFVRNTPARPGAAGPSATEAPAPKPGPTPTQPSGGVSRSKFGARPGQPQPPPVAPPPAVKPDAVTAVLKARKGMERDIQTKENKQAANVQESVAQGKLAKQSGVQVAEGGKRVIKASDVGSDEFKRLITPDETGHAPYLESTELGKGFAVQNPKHPGGGGAKKAPGFRRKTK